MEALVQHKARHNFNKHGSPSYRVNRGLATDARPQNRFVDNNSSSTAFAKNGLLRWGGWGRVVLDPRPPLAQDTRRLQQASLAHPPNISCNHIATGRKSTQQKRLIGGCEVQQTSTRRGPVGVGKTRKQSEMRR